MNDSQSNAAVLKNYREQARGQLEALKQQARLAYQEALLATARAKSSLDELEKIEIPEPPK